MGRIAWVSMSLLLGAACAVSLAQEAQVQGAIAAKFAALPPNTWLNLGLAWMGGDEVPACFDQANGLFFKYGGCGDKTPPINIKFPKGDARHPNGYSNTCYAVDMAKGAWVTICEYDASWPMDRPGNGCSRAYCYDSKRKLIWMYGGQSDGGGGLATDDLISFDGKTQKFTPANSKHKPSAFEDGSPASIAMAYDPLHDLLIMPRKTSTLVYKPAENSWEVRPMKNGPPTPPGTYGSLVFDTAAKRVVFPGSFATGKTSLERPADTDASVWKLGREKTYYEYAEEVWTYDPVTNLWERLKFPPQGARPAPRSRRGLTYDSKNQVVVQVGGSHETWGPDEKYYNDVWILETGKAAWTKMNPPAPLPGGSTSRDNRQCAYDEAHNVILWQPRLGTVWAYRYK